MPRPTHVHLDPRRCIGCLVCHELAPDLMEGRPVPVRHEVLDAMTECPTGALRWSEREEGFGSTR